MRTLAVLVALVFLSSSVLAESVRNNDAGSGRDAPDAEAAAMPVAWGDARGYVLASDADWYAASASSPSCVELEVTGAGIGLARLTTTTTTGQRAAGAAAYNASTVKLGIASDAATYRAGIASLQSSSTNGDYSFRLTRIGVDAVTSDAGTGYDAGTAARAVPVAPGCIGGRLDAAALDMSDEYVLATPVPGNVTVSFVASTASATLDILGPAGNVLGSLRPGDAVSLPAPAAGTYTMRASSSSASSPAYLIGIIAGPEPPSCTPNC